MRGLTKVLLALLLLLSNLMMIQGVYRDLDDDEFCLLGKDTTYRMSLIEAIQSNNQKDIEYWIEKNSFLDAGEVDELLNFKGNEQQEKLFKKGRDYYETKISCFKRG